MSLWHIAWSYLWNRRFTTVMSIISLALSVGLISTVLTLREQTRRRFEEEGQSFDMVVGAKGNPLQLVLSAVYFLDLPKGTMSMDEFEQIKSEEDQVQAAFPICMGDTFKGFRLVGTTPDLFDYKWGSDLEKGFELADGKCFEKPFEAVMGAVVAESSDLRVGDTFYSTHGAIGGHIHENHPYTVCGILERSHSPNDRAIFCDVESIFAAHEHTDHEGEDDHEDELEHEEEEMLFDDGIGVRGKVSAVLVKLHSPIYRYEFRDMVNTEYNAMAVIPIEQIQQLYEQLLGTAKAVLLAIGYLVVVISSITIMIGLYMSILQRRRDLAIMRALGASPGEIFGSILIEAFWVSILGLAAGWAVGTGVCWTLGLYMTRKVGFQVGAITWTADLVTAYSIVILVGLIAGLLPAIQAYRTNVARDLAHV